jgi:PIN domain-containing protein
VPGPQFFVDRSLGRVRVPMLLRDSGWSLVTLAEHYGVPHDEAVEDVVWLRLAGEQGWPVLMKDERIRYRTAERRALMVHGVRAFCLTSGNLDAQSMADCFLRHQHRIWTEAARTGPALFAVSRRDVQEVVLDD